MKGFFGSLKRFFFRTLVYLPILLWSLIKLSDIDQQFNNFKVKYRQLVVSLQLHKTEIPVLFEDETLSLGFLTFTVFEVIFGVFGLFGSFWGNLLSSIFFVINNLIYFNPFLPESTFSFLKPREEIILNFGTLAGLLLIIFYPYESNDDEDEDVQTSHGTSKKKEKIKKEAKGKKKVK